MKIKLRGLPILFFILLLFLSLSALCQVRLPRLISDGMVLQRNALVKIWGWASPGEYIKIDFIGKTFSSKSDAEGKWSIALSDLEPGGPYSMEINASNHLTINNILIGDVWLCSGQSNMETTMSRVKPNYEEIISNSENQFIRYYDLPDRYDFNTPQEDMPQGSWESTDPQKILKFAAVPYFYAKSLYEKYKIPIGLINASVGGAPIEAFLSQDALKAFPDHMLTAVKFMDSSFVNQIIRNDRAVSKAWYDRIYQLDKGYSGDKPWFDPDYNASDWPTMNLPSFWKDEGLGPINGVVWFRKDITLPSSFAGKSAKLNLGRIVDSDSAFVNGQFVGTTGYQYPPRRYSIPENVLQAGRNVIVIRVISNSGAGGSVKDKPYELIVDGQTIDLKGNWQYKLGAQMDPMPGQTSIRNMPQGLFNAMIAPLTSYSIKGVIWYQGESNAERPAEYSKLFPAMISDWRDKWDSPDLPFVYVQLPNFMEKSDKPSESNWALFREVQLNALSIPNTGMAVTIDLGEWNDIHPLNKEDVGKRLALASQRVAYGDEEVVLSPVYQSSKTEGNKIVITFTNTGSGLVASDGKELRYFAIAGEDKNFVWAKAKIVGNKVEVWNDSIHHPVAVRYAWADNPEGANLYNLEGLPASPFRTDDF
jgi:sialate O-acetylesterase